MADELTYTMSFQYTNGGVSNYWAKSVVVDAGGAINAIYGSEVTTTPTAATEIPFPTALDSATEVGGIWIYNTATEGVADNIAELTFDAGTKYFLRVRPGHMTYIDLGSGYSSSDKLKAKSTEAVTLVYWLVPRTAET